MDRFTVRVDWLAWSCWGLAFTLVTLDLFMASRDDVGHLGMVFGAAGGTLHIRGWFCRLERRERNAYELGRDSLRQIRQT